MRFVSTRGQGPPVPFGKAMEAGLAPDGGLYVPERFPDIDPDAFDPAAPFAATSRKFLAPFLDGDPLAEDLDSICAGAFDFPLPLEGLDERTAVLELFHGPTAAFKDFGARFLAGCFARRIAAGDAALTILVATSGDTGSAVAAAFHRKPGTRVGVLFPQGGVSARQERQLTCWDDNVRSFAVRGTFDDCQRVVKQVFRDPAWGGARLTSANSINIGRLLPQAAYHAAAALRFRAAYGHVPDVIVPSGNLGNAVGAFWARRCGFPIGRIVLACNANRTVPDWFADGAWTPRPSVPTLANAMDVGDPSNMERLFHLYPQRSDFLAGAACESVDDATIREVIAEGPGRWNRVFCPHTATAIHLLDRDPAAYRIVAATAHPAKFDSIVEPLVGRPVEVPPALADLLDRPVRVTEIDADPAVLMREMA